MKFTYHINLDERGEFYADVRNANDTTVFEIRTPDGENNNIFEDGYMRNKTDTMGLEKYLRQTGVMQKEDFLIDESSSVEYAEGGGIGDESVQMVSSQAKEAKHHADELHNVLKGEKHLDPWVVAKMERATTDLSDVTHYIDGKKNYRNGGAMSSQPNVHTYTGQGSLMKYQKDRIENVSTYVAPNGTNLELVTMTDPDSSTGMMYAILVNGRGLWATSYRDKAKEYYNEEMERYKQTYALGGRTKSALMRDRAYKSSEPWELNYNRKTRPKNPHYSRYDDGGLIRDKSKNDFMSMFNWYLDNNETPVSKGMLMDMAYPSTASVDSSFPASLMSKVDNQMFFVYDYTENKTFGTLVDLREKLKYSNVPVNLTIVKNGELMYGNDLPDELIGASFHKALNYVFNNDDVSMFNIVPKSDKYYAEGGGVGSPAQWIRSLNLSAFNDEAASMIKNEILTDPHLDDLSENDEFYVKFKNYVLTSVPKALEKAPAGAAPASAVNELEELKARLRTLKKMADKKPKDEDLSARVRTMEKRIAMMEKSGKKMATGGGVGESAKPKMVRTIFEEEEFEYAGGGGVNWENVQIGDAALLKDANKLGVVMGIHDDMFLIQFADGTSSNHSADELMFIADDQYKDGGRMIDDVEMYLMIHGFYPESVMAMRGDGMAMGIVKGDRSKFELSSEDAKIADEMGYEFDYEEKRWVQKDDDDYAKGGNISNKIIVYEYNSQKDYENGKPSKEIVFKNEDEARVYAFNRHYKEYVNLVLYNSATKAKSYYGIDSGEKYDNYDAELGISYAEGGDVKIGDEPPIIRQVFEDTEELDYAKGGGVESLSEFNQELIKEKGYYIGDNIVISVGEKGSIIFPYKEIDAGKIIGFKEKGRDKSLNVITDKNYVIDYYSIIKKYAEGGMATFDDKVKAISERLEGSEVSPKYRKKYGKKYNKSEAQEAAKNIAGAMRKKENQ